MQKLGRRIILVLILVFLASVSIAGDPKPFSHNIMLIVAGLVSIYVFEVSSHITSGIPSASNRMKKWTYLKLLSWLLLGIIALLAASITSGVCNYKGSSCSTETNIMLIAALSIGTGIVTTTLYALYLKKKR